jgi:hypothetical protein
MVEKQGLRHKDDPAFSTKQISTFNAIVEICEWTRGYNEYFFSFGDSLL